MKIVFYSAKPYDKIWFESLQQEYGMDIRFVESSLNLETAILAKNSPAVCIFVNDTADKEVIDTLRPFLINDGGNIEFVKYENNIVYIQMMGACSNCVMLDLTLKEGIEVAIKEEVPEVKEVINLKDMA